MLISRHRGCGPQNRNRSAITKRTWRSTVFSLDLAQHYETFARSSTRVLHLDEVGLCMTKIALNMGDSPILRKSKLVRVRGYPGLKPALDLLMGILKAAFLVNQSAMLGASNFPPISIE